MSSRVLTALGVVAVVVALVSLAALALAAVHSDDPAADVANSPAGERVSGSAAKRPAREPAASTRARVPVQKPTPVKPAAKPATVPAAAAPRVPALAQRPAQGPAYAIAHLRPGARTAMWSSPGSGFVENLGPRTEFGSPVVLSIVKTSHRWLGVTSADMPNGELGWIRRDPRKVEVYWTEYSLHANLSALRLTLRYGRARVSRFVVTVGAPGSETPTGRYGITDALSFDESPFYGCCALAISGRQTHLPAGWIGGNRLAIHGTPGPVGGAESHGCIRATDATMRKLFREVPLGTPVFIDE
jgi:lipoprotein-anchoring transpeptidase ErfK/SrfK